jgi:hypothetical protein
MVRVPLSPCTLLCIPGAPCSSHPVNPPRSLPTAINMQQAITATMRLVATLLFASLLLMALEATPALAANRRALRAVAADTLEGSRRTSLVHMLHPLPCGYSS